MAVNSQVFAHGCFMCPTRVSDDHLCDACCLLQREKQIAEKEKQLQEKRRSKVSRRELLPVPLEGPSCT